MDVNVCVHSNIHQVTLLHINKEAETVEKISYNDGSMNVCNDEKTQHNGWKRLAVSVFTVGVGGGYNTDL